MHLADIDWATLTQAQAKRLVGPADRAEQAAAKRFNGSDAPGIEAVWREAYDLWEDLQVYAICGEKPTR